MTSRKSRTVLKGIHMGVSTPNEHLWSSVKHAVHAYDRIGGRTLTSSTHLTELFSSQDIDRSRHIQYENPYKEHFTHVACRKSRKLKQTMRNVMLSFLQVRCKYLSEAIIVEMGKNGLIVCVIFESFWGAALDHAGGLTAPPRPPAGFDSLPSQKPP